MVIKVITHPGPAHFDDFMTCCLIVAQYEGVSIERREPTEAELNSPQFIVVDIGGRHEPVLNNYDHHQFPRDAEPACSITLILSLLGIHPKEAREVWNWLEFAERLDSKGPFATANWLGMEPDNIFKTVSPIATTVINYFSKHTMIDDYDEFYELMYAIGKEKLDYFKAVKDRIKYLEEYATFHTLHGIHWVDIRCIAKEDNPSLGQEMFLRKQDIDCPITVSEDVDPRGNGYTLYRRNDDKRVDFSLLEGEDDVIFAHKGGFVAKVEPVDEDRLRELLIKSLV
jgi:hypothetical protein